MCNMKVFSINFYRCRVVKHYKWKKKEIMHIICKEFINLIKTKWMIGLFTLICTDLVTITYFTIQILVSHPPKIVTCTFVFQMHFTLHWYFSTYCIVLCYEYKRKEVKSSSTVAVSVRCISRYVKYYMKKYFFLSQ